MDEVTVCEGMRVGLVVIGSMWSVGVVALGAGLSDGEGRVWARLGRCACVGTRGARMELILG